jgi:predicted RNA binding protein with dsRBD fold (UPF0201 family)
MSTSNESLSSSEFLKFKNKNKYYTIDCETYYKTKDGREICINFKNNLEKIKEDYDVNQDLLLEVNFVETKEPMDLNIDEIDFSSKEVKDLIPYIYYKDKRMFFYRTEQTLIDSNEKVNVLRYTSDNKVLARSENNEEKEYEPLKDFVNWENHCKKQYERSQMNQKKLYPTTLINYEGQMIPAKIYPCDEKVSIKSTGEMGKIVSNDKDKTKYVFMNTSDRSKKLVSLDELLSGENIKNKAINHFKKKNNNFSNTIQLEEQTSSSTSRTVTNTSNVSYSSVLTSGKNQNLERNSDKVSISREDLEELLQLKEASTKIYSKYNL